MDNKNQDPSTASQDKETVSLENPSRRKVFSQLGRYSVYTAPVIMTLMVSKKTSAASFGGPPTLPT